MNNTNQQNQPIIFIDSGIGGLPYCREFSNANPNENVYYIADTKNYPYGMRSKDELTSILLELTEKLIQKFAPKIIVLACNTATIASITALREKFSKLQFVGTVPAIKPAAAACSNGKVGVLGTKRTIEEIHNLHLTEKPCEIFGVSAPDLVDFVELHFDNSSKEEKLKIVKKYTDIFKNENINTLVLGCTHFLFLTEEFSKEAGSGFKIFDSLDGITKRIEFLLDENDGKLRNSGTNGTIRKLLLTDKSKCALWENRADEIGFKLVMLDDL